MLTLNASWLSSFGKSSVEVRLLCEITPAAGTSFKFLTAPCIAFAYPCSFASMTPVTREIDVWTRKTAIGAISITLQMDGLVESMLQGYRLRGKKVQVWLGAADLSEANFESFFVGTVHEIVINAVERKLTLKVKDANGILADSVISAAWHMQHPLQIFQDILDRAGIVSALYDGTSLDPTDASNSTVGHFNTNIGLHSAGWQQNAAIDVKAIEALQHAAATMDGLAYVAEDGKITFKVFDSSAATDASWTNDDIADFEIADSIGKLCNRVTVRNNFFNIGEITNESNFRSIYVRNDTDSQTNFAYPGASDQIFAEQIDLLYASAFTTLNTTMTTTTPAGETSPGAADGGTITLYGQMLGGVCGMRWPGFPSGSQPVSAQIGSGNLGRLKIGNEIISYDNISISTAHFTKLTAWDPDSDAFVQFTVPFQATFRIKNRNALDTDAEAHAIGDYVYDVTMPVYVAKARIDRFSNGAPVIECSTSLAQYAVQLGDLVDITTDQYQNFGKASLTNATKWEVVAKLVEPFSNPPRIRWKLVWATDSGAATPTVASSTPKFLLDNGFFLAIGNQDNSRVFVIEGLTEDTAQRSGLVTVITRGVISSIWGRTDTLQDVSNTYTATKDTFVSASLSTGQLNFYVQTVDSAAPTVAVDEVLVARVQTDGSGVVGVEDLRPLRGWSIGISQTNTERDYGRNILPNGGFSLWSND